MTLSIRRLSAADTGAATLTPAAWPATSLSDRHWGLSSVPAATLCRQDIRRGHLPETSWRPDGCCHAQKHPSIVSCGKTTRTTTRHFAPPLAPSFSPIIGPPQQRTFQQTLTFRRRGKILPTLIQRTFLAISTPTAFHLARSRFMPVAGPRNGWGEAPGFLIKRQRTPHTFQTTVRRLIA